jgi:redox-sensitive bicupin YhaK (pirin superfamily)
MLDKNRLHNDDLRLSVRPASERGTANFGWLKSSHSFSFGQYFDPRYMGYGNLRVINDDLVAGGMGFGEHPHQNAEIFSYVMDGALEHRDSLGNGSVVSAGGIQYMSAGSGVTHSEFNPSSSEEMRFLQIWLIPEIKNTTPSYDTLDLSEAEKEGKLKLFLSPDGRMGSMKTLADAYVYAAKLDAEQIIETDLKDDRRYWIQVANGSLMVNGEPLSKGDGLAVEGNGNLIFSQGQQAEFLFFDLVK